MLGTAGIGAGAGRGGAAAGGTTRTVDGDGETAGRVTGSGVGAVLVTTTRGLVDSVRPDEGPCPKDTVKAAKQMPRTAKYLIIL